MHPSAFRLPPCAILALILAMGGLPASGQSLLKSHGHNNLPVLQKLTAPGGVLTYDGAAVGGSVTLAGTPDYITISGSTITRAAVNLTSHVTGTLPVANGGTGITALGTGITTALGINVGSAGAPVLFDGAGGTPSSLTLTNATGLPGTAITGDSLTLTKVALSTTSTHGQISLTNATGAVAWGIRGGVSGLDFYANSTWIAQLAGASASVAVMYVNAFADYSNGDTFIRPRDASGTATAGAISFRNSTTAHSLYPHNTYTGTTNYERAAMGWASNVFKVGTQKGSGGGTARDMILVTDDTERLRFGATGEFILTSKAAPANASDTGTAGEIRVDASYIYICTATNTWKRVAIATW